MEDEPGVLVEIDRWMLNQPASSLTDLLLLFFFAATGALNASSNASPRSARSGVRDGAMGETGYVYIERERERDIGRSIDRSIGQPVLPVVKHQKNTHMVYI